MGKRFGVGYRSMHHSPTMTTDEFMPEVSFCAADTTGGIAKCQQLREITLNISEDIIRNISLHATFTQ